MWYTNRDNLERILIKMDSDDSDSNTEAPIINIKYEAYLHNCETIVCRRAFLCLKKWYLSHINIVNPIRLMLLFIQGDM